MKRAKQISYLSAIMICIGSTIGAGIFIKNHTIFQNTSGNVSMAIAAWCISGFGILAIGLALVELTSKGKTDGGVLEWSRRFLPKSLHRYSSSYVTLIYLPLACYVAMPIYIVMSLQDASNGMWKLNTWGLIGIAFAIFSWTSIVSMVSLKFAERLQWVLTIIKFIPLIAIVIFAIINMQREGHAVFPYASARSTGLTGRIAWFGIFASMPAILFAVDGFYTVTTLRSNLKKEKSLGSIIALSISIIIGVYLIFAIVTGYGGDNIKGIDWLPQGVRATLDVMIAMAILGILNGFSMAIPRMTHEYNVEFKSIPISFLQKKFKFKGKYTAPFIFQFLLCIFFFSIIAIFAHYSWTTASYTQFDSTGNIVGFSYGKTAGYAYDIIDLVTNFTSLLVFIIIGCVIIGGIANRRSKKHKVIKSKYFISSAIVSIIFLAIATIYMFTESIFNMFGYNGADQKTAFVKFVILIGILFFSSLPQIVIFFKHKTIHV